MDEPIEQQEQEQNKPKRGGKRVGSGRKPRGGVGTIHIGLRIRKDIAEALKQQENVSQYVERAVLTQLRRDGYLREKLPKITLK